MIEPKLAVTLTARGALTVHAQNPARQLCGQCGFRHAGDPGPDYRLMVARVG